MHARLIRSLNQLRLSLGIYFIRLLPKLYCSAFRKMSIILIAMMSSTVVFSHGETIEISEKARGPVHLSKQQAAMIDLKLTIATKRPLAKLLGLNGEIQLLPDAQADVSIRISGSVTELYANLGDHVKAGQRLAKIQSRLVGDPPPSVVITAPIDGVVDARNVNLGQAVEPNTVLFHISHRDQLIVLAQIYEEDLGKIKVGQEATIQVLSYPNKTFTGKITLIEPNLDPLTRTVNVRIILDNKQGLLKPGMFARANVILQKNEAALTVPNSAIIDAHGEKFVFLRQGDTYERIKVKIGLADDDYTEIKNGLVSGDEVATQGNRQLYTLWLTGGQIQSEEGHH